VNDLQKRPLLVRLVRLWLRVRRMERALKLSLRLVEIRRALPILEDEHQKIQGFHRATAAIRLRRHILKLCRERQELETRLARLTRRSRS
jgi:hypothetical protein